MWRMPQITQRRALTLAFSALTVLSCRAASSSDLLQPVQSQPTPLPLVAPGDEVGPLLTPDIRKREPAPDLKPDRKPEPKPDAAPERKAEPKSPPPPQQKQARPAPDPKGKSGPKADARTKPAEKPGLAVAQPRTAAERDKALSDLYAFLATAEDAKQAATVSASIERLWITSGSDTVSLLMQRAMQASNAKDPELALKLLDAVVSLAPDYAEGWNRRAYVHYTQNHIDLAMGDLRRTLALDPNHFKALDGLMHILNDIGRKKDALQAARRLLEVNPFYESARQVVDELSREVEGRGI